MAQSLRSAVAPTLLAAHQHRSSQGGQQPVVVSKQLPDGGWRGGVDGEASLGGRPLAAASAVALAARAGCRLHRKSRVAATAVSTARTETAPATESGDQGEEQRPARLGIVHSLSDLPKTEALGIELRASAALAAPISVLKGGDFVEEPLLVRHELNGNAQENAATVCRTIRHIVKHFCWKGVVGCSVTIAISKEMGIFGQDFGKLERDTGRLFVNCLRGKASFCHTVVHTDAAAYDELVFGESADEAMWSGQLVLICTLGMHIGAVLYNDGHRVRNSPINSIFTSKWCTSLSDVYGGILDRKFEPPQPGHEAFSRWAELVDRHISSIAQAVSTVDRIIIIPTGRTCNMEGLPKILDPLLVKTRKVVSHVSVMDPREGACVRGVALCALIEMGVAQVVRSLEGVLSGDQALQSLSEAQIRMIFNKIDANADGVIEISELRETLLLLGIDRDVDVLVRELDTSDDDRVDFKEFQHWWWREVNKSKIVLLTSADAWKRVVSQEPPEGYGELLLLAITFTFCRSCRAFAGKFKRYAEKYTDTRFVQLSGNSSIGAMELATQDLGVKVSPAFFIFRRGGELVTSWTGTNTKKFEEEVEASLEAEAELRG